MAAAKGLRAVEPGETAQPAKKLSIIEAAAAGDHLETLRGMRDRIAAAVQDPNCPPRDLSSLTKRLQEVMREIEATEARLAEEAAESADVPDEEWTPEAL